jgi:hypothetical protein
MKAIEVFDGLEDGILKLIKASDVYALHIMSDLRKEAPDLNAIKTIIEENRVSGFNVVGDQYKAGEIEFLKKEKKFTHIGQQIFLATHTALDVYLIEKFREYFRHMSKSETAFTEAGLGRVNNKGIDRLKENYRDFFDIHLDLFDMEYILTTDNCSFQPNSNWEAIKIIYEERNNIAHKGRALKYEFILLADAWYPFEFVRRWVQSFNANFDMKIYEGFITESVREHDKKGREKDGNSKKKG